MRYDWHETDLAAHNELRADQVTVRIDDGEPVIDASTVPTGQVAIYEARFPQLIAQRRAEGQRLDCLRLIGSRGVVDVRPAGPGDPWTWELVDPYTGSSVSPLSSSVIDLVLAAMQMIAPQANYTGLPIEAD